MSGVFSNLNDESPTNSNKIGFQQVMSLEQFNIESGDNSSLDAMTVETNGGVSVWLINACVSLKVNSENPGPSFSNAQLNILVDGVTVPESDHINANIPSRGNNNFDESQLTLNAMTVWTHSNGNSAMPVEVVTSAVIDDNSSYSIVNQPGGNKKYQSVLRATRIA